MVGNISKLENSSYFLLGGSHLIIISISESKVGQEKVGMIVDGRSTAVRTDGQLFRFAKVDAIIIL